MIHPVRSYIDIANVEAFRLFEIANVFYCSFMLGKYGGQLNQFVRGFSHEILNSRMKEIRESIMIDMCM